MVLVGWQLLSCWDSSSARWLLAACCLWAALSVLPVTPGSRLLSCPRKTPSAQVLHYKQLGIPSRRARSRPPLGSGPHMRSVGSERARAVLDLVACYLLKGQGPGHLPFMTLPHECACSVPMSVGIDIHPVSKPSILNHLSCSNFMYLLYYQQKQYQKGQKLHI